MAFSLTTSIFAAPASALERGDMVVSGGLMFTPILHGKASDGDDAPKYKDLFNTGFGLSLEGFYVINSLLRAGGSFGVSYFSGQELEGAEVNRWWVVPMMVGAQVFMTRSEEAFLRPYFKVDAGMVYYSAAQVDNPKSEVDYKLFRTSTAWAGDLGLGVEWNFGSDWKMFGDIRYMLASPPREAGDLNVNDPRVPGFLPIRIGLAYSY